jgi:hypothetical protein
MNRGTIDRMWNNEYVISHSYVTPKGQLIKQEFPIHPYYSKFNWTIGTNILFQYAMECEEHYPYSCNCSGLTLFALPIETKEKSSLITKLKKLFSRC